MYDNLRVDKGNVEFEEEEIDEADFKAQEDVQGALETAKHLEQGIRKFKKKVKQLNQDIKDGTFIYKRLAPPKSQKRTGRLHAHGSITDSIIGTGTSEDDSYLAGAASVSTDSSDDGQAPKDDAESVNRLLKKVMKRKLAVVQRKLSKSNRQKPG